MEEGEGSTGVRTGGPGALFPSSSIFSLSEPNSKSEKSQASELCNSTFGEGSQMDCLCPEQSPHPPVCPGAMSHRDLAILNFHVLAFTKPSLPESAFLKKGRH